MKNKIKHMIVMNSFNFFANYDENSSIYKICAKCRIKDTTIYGRYNMMVKNGLIDKNKRLTEKGREIQKEMKELDYKLMLIK